MIPKLIAAGCLLLSCAFPQGSRPSPETLIEKARVIAEEQGNPKKAVLLITEKIICRADLSKSQFDRAVRMLSIYLGGKPPKAQEKPFPPIAQIDLVSGIQKEISAYLAGKGSFKSVTWYGKTAVPYLLETLKQNYFRPGYAEKIIRLLIAVDLKSASSFLRKLRKNGPSPFRDIVERALHQASPGKPSEAQKLFLKEILAWAETSPDPIGLLRPTFRYLDEESFMTFLEKHPKNLDVLKALSRFLRTRKPAPLARSEVFLNLVKEALKTKDPRFPQEMRAYRLVPWLLKQQGGFQVVLALFSHPKLELGSLENRTLRGSILPSASKGLPLFLEVLRMKPRSRVVWESLYSCLEIWKKELNEPSPLLQKGLLQLLSQAVAYSESKNGQSVRLASRITVQLIASTQASPASFQVALWEKALQIHYNLEFRISTPGWEHNPQTRQLGFGPEVLLFQWKDRKKPLLSQTLDEEQRIQIVLKALGRSQFQFTRPFYEVISPNNFQGGYFVPQDLRVGFIRAMSKHRDLLEKVLKKQGAMWLVLLPKDEAKRLFFQLWKDPKIPYFSFASYLWERLRQEENPEQFLKRALQERPDLTPAFISYGQVEKSYANLLMDWIESHGPSWIHERWVARLPSLLVALPSQRSKAFLAKLLLSRVALARKNAAQVLDGWKRLEEIQQGQKDRDLQKQLWLLVNSAQPIPARIVALEGLFDLGDKAAWLTLSRWLGSDNKALRAAALEFSRRRKAGK